MAVNKLAYEEYSNENREWYNSAKQKFAKMGSRTLQEKIKRLEWRHHDLQRYYAFALLHDTDAKIGFEEYLRAQEVKKNNPAITNFKDVKMTLASIKKYLDQGRQPRGANRYILMEIMGPLIIPIYEKKPQEPEVNNIKIEEETEAKVSPESTEDDSTKKLSHKIVEAYAQYTKTTFEQALQTLILNNFKTTDFFKQMKDKYPEVMTVDRIMTCFKNNDISLRYKETPPIKYSKPKVSTNHNVAAPFENGFDF